MKAAFHTGAKEITVRDVEIPKPGPGEVLVKISACAICGSDTWWPKDPGAGEGIHGHESVGLVAENGPGASRFKKGERVVCYAIQGCGACPACKAGYVTACPTKRFIENGFAEYAVYREDMLFPAPKEFDDVTATLLSDAIGVPLRALRRLPPSKGDTVVVWGMGPLGLLQSIFLKSRGVKTLIGVDRVDERLAVAREFGVGVTINPAKENAVEAIARATGGKLADKAYNYVRVPAVTHDAFNGVKLGGSICTLTGLDGQYQLGEWVERTLVWSFYFLPSEYKENVAIAKRHHAELKRTVSGVFPLARINEAFASRFDAQDKSIKIVVTP